jgi:hypothetical protein
LPGYVCRSRPLELNARASRSYVGSQDEDRKPRRGGSLERDQPTSPPIDTLKRPWTACSHAARKRTRGDSASAGSRRGGGDPWRAENPRRGSAPIVRGNTRRPEYGLPIRAETPGGALETGCVLAHDSHSLSLGRVQFGRRVATRTTERARTLATADRCSGDITGRAMVDSKRQEGQGTSRDAPAVGRENPLKGEPQECRRYETRPAG